MTDTVIAVVVLLSMLNLFSSILAYRRGQKHAYERVYSYLEGGRDELKQMEGIK